MVILPKAAGLGSVYTKRGVFPDDPQRKRRGSTLHSCLEIRTVSDHEGRSLLAGWNRENLETCLAAWGIPRQEKRMTHRLAVESEAETHDAADRVLQEKQQGLERYTLTIDVVRPRSRLAQPRLALVSPFPYGPWRRTRARTVAVWTRSRVETSLSGGWIPREIRFAT